jgi:hypothetical protein
VFVILGRPPDNHLSLSYSSTMEVLETARVDAYCCNDIIVPSSRRGQLLCVVWEGTCVERDKRMSKVSLSDNTRNLALIDEDAQEKALETMTVWHAGDWTGPIALQPERRMSGESDQAANTDIVAMSTEGVKVITVEFAALHNILMTGSPLYRKYLDRRSQQHRRLSYAEGIFETSLCLATQKLLTDCLQTMNVLDLLDQNSALRKLSAVQKRHLESLAEGPVAFNPGERLWRSGAPVENAFLVVAGTASFVPRRRNAGSASVPSAASLANSSYSGTFGVSGMQGNLKSHHMQIFDPSYFYLPVAHRFQVKFGRRSRRDARRCKESRGGNGEFSYSILVRFLNSLPIVPTQYLYLIQGEGIDKSSDDTAYFSEDEGQIQLDSLFSRSTDGKGRSMTEAHDFAKLSKTLRIRAESLTKDRGHSSDVSIGSSHDDCSQDSISHVSVIDDAGDIKDRRASLTRRRSSRARFANKVLGRLYSRRAFTGGLVFSRGHFLGDVSKMVAGLYTASHGLGDQSFPVYGFGDKSEGTKSAREHISDWVIHEVDDASHVVHSSTLTAGKDGCVVLVFPKASLIPFLDNYPGLLLSLLGTQVVV